MQVISLMKYIPAQETPQADDQSLHQIKGGFYKETINPSDKQLTLNMLSSYSSYSTTQVGTKDNCVLSSLFILLLPFTYLLINQWIKDT